ncbi:prolyl oligopeptidase family serine peptidase [Varibaculum vaginae]|uniref:prolyl oligopeptidase family serine peptidase n=1 Tax=Varibaculum vaginae TaxID=2364797 RepID=UPI001F376F03|nr:prolyl oligopeptidase family serine peptidase [Varibaculum vaginae]
MSPTLLRPLPKYESIVKVRGEILLPDGSTFYPQWKTSGSTPIYGGYQDACEALVYSPQKVEVITHKSGNSFPLGQHVKPIKVLDHELYIQTSSFINAPRLYRLDRKTGELTCAKNNTSQYNNAFTCQQIWATSEDGTQIPIDCFGKLTGKQPTIVFIYGGFGRSNHSFYSPDIYSKWLTHGYSIAVIHSRGGAEYGKSWHQAGVKAGRRQVRADIASSIRELHRQNICTPETTFIHGMSHGALLAAITAIHHPELVSQVVCRVPISSTKHLSKTTLGRQWLAEYGNPQTTDWDNFMKQEDPLACNVNPESLSGTSWLIIGYCRDEVTTISHADSLVERVKNLRGTATYWRYSSKGGHEGAVDPNERITHERRLWSYLSQKAADLKMKASYSPC